VVFYEVRVGFCCVCFVFSGCDFLDRKGYDELDVSEMKACFWDDDCVLVTNNTEWLLSGAYFAVQGFCG